MLATKWMWALFALPLDAHVVSMSTGELRVDGPTATYELRMPLYEVVHTPNPERALLEHVRFGDAHVTTQYCREESGTYVCRASYEFPAPVDTLTVECTLPAVTVPNHVHLLRAVKGTFFDQAVFDVSFTRAQIRFRPPTPGEMAARELAGGWWRAVSSVAGLLFLASLALAARSRREFLALVGMLLAGEALACLLAPRLPLALAPRFIEAAMALTVGYLAVEILLLPQAGGRWLVVGALGVFHGLYFAGLPALFLAGALAGQLMLLAALLAAHRYYSTWRKTLAGLLLMAGLGWFLVRVAG